MARRAATLGTHALGDAVDQLTNLRRRLGLAGPDPASIDLWARYLDGLEVRPDLGDQVAWTLRFAADTPIAARPSSAVARAGPFSVHVDGDLLRTHFMPRSTSARSPLDPSCLPDRRRELRTALASAHEQHPETRRVRGTSWLYATRSYRAVFPPAHVATAVVRTDVHRFPGSSAWGQFLDHRGGVKADLGRRFVTAVDGWDGTEPWALFPIPTLVVESPIEVFDVAGEPAAPTAARPPRE